MEEVEQHTRDAITALLAYPGAVDPRIYQNLAEALHLIVERRKVEEAKKQTNTKQKELF